MGKTLNIMYEYYKYLYIHIIKYVTIYLQNI